MRDATKLSEDFVQFANESKKRLHELRRDWLDGLQTPVGIEPADVVKSTLAPHVPQIHSIFLPDDMPAEQVQEQLSDAVRTWVCSRAMAGQSLSFFIIGKDAGVEVYLADDDANAELLQGAFPGVAFGAKKNPCKEAAAFKHASLITGTPTAIHKDTILAYSCDQLLRGMRGRRFMLALVAKSIPRAGIQDLLRQTQQAINDNHNKIKQRLTDAVGENTANTIGASVGFSAGLFAAFISTITISSNMSVTVHAAPMGVGVDTTMGGGVAMTLGATVGAYLSGNASANASRTKGKNSTRSSDEERNNQFAQAYESKLNENESRLTAALSEGLWQVAAYLFADTTDDLEACSSIYLSSLTSRFDPQEVFRSIPVSSSVASSLCIPRFLNQPQDQRDAFTIMTTSELSSMVSLPVEDHPGIVIKKVPRFSQNLTAPIHEKDVVLGNFCDRNVAIRNQLAFSPSDLTGHALISGITGSGKSTTIRAILSQLNVPFLVLEPAKREYRNLKIPNASIRVITAGDESVAPFRINPFEIVDGDTLHSNIDALAATINAAFPMEGPMAALVEQGLLRVYKDAGWDTSTGAPPEDFKTPTMDEFYAALERTVEEQRYEGEYGSNIKSALLTRINSLRIGPRGRLFNSELPFDVRDLLSRPTVIEMRKIGSDETKAFLTGILLYRIYRYLEASDQTNPDASLKSVLVIEEAHRLFRKTAETNGGIAGNNTKHHSVEMFENIMAEVRAYGLGIVIADQLPLRLSDGAVKNTNIKIIHRLASREDAVDMGGSMGLDERKSAFVNTLPRGEALAICPSLIEAAHVRVIPRGMLSVGGVSDQEVRKMTHDACLVRPPHFDTMVERVKEQDPRLLCCSGSRFLLVLQLCSSMRVNEFWNDAIWQMFRDVQGLGIPVASGDGSLWSAHLLHHAVGVAIRQRTYLDWRQRQALLVLWERCLRVKGCGQEWLDQDSVNDMKMRMRAFAKTHAPAIPRWTGAVISDTRILPLFGEAGLFAETLYQDRTKDVTTTMRRDVSATAAIVAHRIRQLSNVERVAGDRYVDFAFAVMIHLLDKIRPEGYEKTVFQSQIYGTLGKILGGQEA